MSNLFLFKYNNFYNRLVKREEAIESYGVPLFVLENANFNPNNGINTQHIINYVTLPETPDYCVITEEGGEISSRWFVMECQRTRGLQYRIALLRDVMAEYRDEILNATSFIEKGFVQQDNPLIFNNENMGFNQIKSGEYVLKNNLQTPWLILYLSRYNGEGEYNSFQGNFRLEESEDDVDYVLDSLEDYKFNYWSNNEYIITNRDDIIFMAEYASPPLINRNWYANITASIYPNINLYGINEIGEKEGITTYSYPPYQYIGPAMGNGPSAVLFSPNFSTVEATYNSGIILQGGLPFNTYSNLGTQSGLNEILAENGKKIKVGNKIYRIEIDTEYYPVKPGFPSPEDLWEMQSKSISPTSALGIEIEKIFQNTYFQKRQSIEDNLKILFKNRRGVKINYLEAGASNLSYNFNYEHAITTDSICEIIAAPFKDITFDNIPGIEGSIKSFGKIAEAWFQNIVNKYNSEGAAYDLQLLPYCPIDSTDLSNENVIFCNSEKSGRQTVDALAIKIRTKNFSKVLSIDNIPIRSDMKLSNEVDLYRLCSPNGVGEYEWSPAKNGSTIGEFEIDCTLIPFNPYIKINPVFYNLYGNDYDDFRGLVCGGDFSMPILNNAWETYQLSNKYYQDIFNRDIKHQEYNNKYEKKQDIANAVFGTLQGGAQGAQAGAAGGPWGMAIGAAVGTVTSAIGGTLDNVYNDRLRRENIQYQKDRFGYELGTIKARSQSLTRSCYFNLNNKYFPYVEYYTCTSVEVEAFKNKLKYNGMTVEVIGRIGDYLEPGEEWTYIQGELIYLDIPEAYQIVEEINSILRGGVRIVYPK